MMESENHVLDTACDCCAQKTNELKVTRHRGGEDKLSELQNSCGRDEWCLGMWKNMQ